jgi:hypothetical protein
MNFVLYAGGSAVTWYLGKNLAFRSTDTLINYVMNYDADPDIKDNHTVKSIRCMLENYKGMDDTDPAYEAMLSVKQCLHELENIIETAKLKQSVHSHGYFTRFRTYDATADNLSIDKKVKDLMARLDLFTKLAKLSIA